MRLWAPVTPNDLTGQLGDKGGTHLEEFHYMMTLGLIVKITRIASTASTRAHFIWFVFITGQGFKVK